MEVAVVIGVVVLILLLLSSKKKKETREVEERVSLRSFVHYDDSPAGMNSSWDVDLVDMTAKHTIADAEDPNDIVSEYRLRRPDSGGWQAQLTQASWQDLVLRLKKEIADEETLFKEDLKERLAEYADGPKWRPLDEDIAGPLESQYQRFVRHYRES